MKDEELLRADVRESVRHTVAHESRLQGAAAGGPEAVAAGAHLCALSESEQQLAQWRRGVSESTRCPVGGRARLARTPQRRSLERQVLDSPDIDQHTAPITCFKIASYAFCDILSDAATRFQFSTATALLSVTAIHPAIICNLIDPIIQSKRLTPLCLLLEYSRYTAIRPTPRHTALEFGYPNESFALWQFF